MAKIGAGTSDEAANNFKNFLTNLFALDTQKRFADQGINISESLMRQKAEGISPIEGMMNVIQWSLEKKGPEAVKQFKAAMALKDDAARDQVLQALQKNFGLGELFADMQVMAFVRPMLANIWTSAAPSVQKPLNQPITMCWALITPSASNPLLKR